MGYGGRSRRFSAAGRDAVGTAEGFGAGAFLLGSLLAGYFIAGRGLKRTLFTLCCIFNIPFAVYALLALFQPSSMWLVGGGIVLEYFGYGFGFVGLTLFMMQQVDTSARAAYRRPR